MGQKPVRALLLDFDGTLANSLPVMYSIYAAMLMERGARPTETEFETLNGPALREIVTVLKGRYGWEEAAEALLLDYKRRIASAYLTQVPPSQGAKQCCDYWRDQHGMVAIVTSSPADLVREWLERCNLSSLIDEVVGGDEVERSKPAPDIYIEALRRLGVEPEEAVAVEDSVRGIQAARAAGIAVWCYGETPVSVDGLAGHIRHFDEFRKVWRQPRALAEA